MVGDDGTRIETEIAVIATGPWSARFLASHGIEAPLMATRHEVLHFRRPLDLVPHHPGGADIGNRIYFRPEGQELTLVGNGNHSDPVEDPEVFAQRASPAFIQDVWQRLARQNSADSGRRTGGRVRWAVYQHSGLASDHGPHRRD